MEQQTSYRIRYLYEGDDGTAYQGGALIDDCASEDDAKRKLLEALTGNRGPGRMKVEGIEEYDIMLEDEGVTVVEDARPEHVFEKLPVQLETEKLRKAKEDIEFFERNYVRVEPKREEPEPKAEFDEDFFKDVELNAFQSFSVGDGWDPGAYLDKICEEHPDEDVV